tara:strand:- start:3704 stop:4252 length:549 start_codon:yes stop_codon:yes gene_type:complete
MFTQLRVQIANYLLIKKIEKINNNLNLITISNSKKIGLLFDANSPNDILLIKQLVKKFLIKNIDVNVLGFVNQNDYSDYHLSSLHINYFNLNDLNWLLYPKSKNIDNFYLNKYDIVINLSLDNSFPTKCITLLSRSKCKIGIFSSNYKLSYDLMFNLKVASLSYFIKELTHYLDLINQNNEK